MILIRLFVLFNFLTPTFKSHHPYNCLENIFPTEASAVGGPTHFPVHFWCLLRYVLTGDSENSRALVNAFISLKWQEEPSSL